MDLDLTETKQSTVRFSEAYFFNPGERVVVLGVGGIGSWLALNLARLDCILELYDMDTVSEVNIAGQMYGSSDVGDLKVEAVRSNIMSFCDIEYDNIILYEKYTKEEGSINPIMFSCFDNMEARKIAFENWASDENRELFIDGRMAMVTGEVYCVTKGKEDEYRQTLFNDSEVEEAACTMKASTFSAMTIAGIMTGLFCNYIGLRKDPDLPVSLPFKTTYNYPLMMFET